MMPAFGGGLWRMRPATSGRRCDAPRIWAPPRFTVRACSRWPASTSTSSSVPGGATGASRGP
eukprot:11212373-Lingulodinium_polyedra.AAC.1